MKPLIAFSICMLACGAVSAQKAKPAPLPPINALPQRDKKFHKSAIGGYFTDMRKRPVKGVKAFVYGADSSIIASGFTDSAGYYETNSMPAGRYDLRILYPGAKFTETVEKVPVVAGKITEVSFRKGEVPAADTSFAYEVIAPKPPEKKVKAPVKK